jgi:hypothetical protein
MVSIVGRVTPNEVPEIGTAVGFGVWTDLARQAIAAYQQDEVLVVTCADRTEFKRMVNGMSETLRKAGYMRRFVSQDMPDKSVQVWMRLVERTSPQPNGSTTSVAPANRRRRRP